MQIEGELSVDTGADPGYSDRPRIVCQNPLPPVHSLHYQNPLLITVIHLYHL